MTIDAKRQESSPWEAIKVLYQQQGNTPIVGIQKTATTLNN